MIKFSFKLPGWLHWLIPAAVRDEQDRRSQLTGKASSSFWRGAVTVHTEQRERTTQ